MVSELILKYVTQGGRGLYRFANLSKKQFCTSKAAFGLSSKMIICDVVVIKTILKPEHQ